MRCRVNFPARPRCTSRNHSYIAVTMRGPVMKKLPLLLLLLSATSLIAQTDRGTVTGTVTDPSGRRVMGASVMIKSLATGLERPAKTNEAGVYTATSLSTGDYQVT